jgi:hypothetical protein
MTYAPPLVNLKKITRKTTAAATKLHSCGFLTKTYIFVGKFKPGYPPVSFVPSFPSR